MSGIVDPSTAEREAREDAERYLLTLDYAGRERKRKVLDAYAAAVRRAERARVVGIVEGEKWIGHHPMCDKSGLAGCCGMAARNAALDAILAKLREEG